LSAGRAELHAQARIIENADQRVRQSAIIAAGYHQRFAFVNDNVAQVIINAQKRTKHSGLGGTEELPDDRTDWDTYLRWFNSLGCPQATIDDVVDHIVHAATVAGIDHVGIGSDFDGVPALPLDLQTAESLPRVSERLQQRGMSDDDIEKILGGNFMRAFEAIENARKA